MVDIIFPQNYDYVPKEDEEADMDLMTAIFLICLYHSLGAPLVGQGRIDFDEYLKSQNSLMYHDDTPESPCDLRYKY